MKNMIITIAILSGMLVAGSYAMQEHPGEHKGHAEMGKHEKGLQTTCPTKMGGKIDKSLYVDYNGKRIYVCCKDCLKMVQKDPEKYIKKLEDKGVTLCKVQTTCPIPMDKMQTTCPITIDKKLYVDHDGKRIYVSGQDCMEKVKQHPAKYIKELEDQGLTLDKVQTTCPISGKKIDKKLYADHDGKRVYFSSDMCSMVFKKDPAKYIKKLEKAGVILDHVPGAEEKKGQEHPKVHKESEGHSGH